MSEEEIEEAYKTAEEIGEIIGRYGTDKQIELFNKILEDYKIKNSGYFRLQKENEELHKQVDIEFVEENYIEKSKVISKDIIRNKIKELEERNKMFKLELPEDVTIYQYGIEVLKELLGE